MKYLYFKNLYRKRYTNKVNFSKQQALLFDIQKKLDDIYSSAIIIPDDFNKFNKIYETFITLIERDDLNDEKIISEIKKINISIHLKYINSKEMSSSFFQVTK